MDKETYTLKQAGQRLDVPVDVVRKICKMGLIRGIRRKRNGYRVLSEEQMEVLGVLARLRQAGFEMGELKKYANLQRQGDKTIPERKGMLETQKRQLWLQLQDLQKGIDYIERTIEILDDDGLRK